MYFNSSELTFNRSNYQNSNFNTEVELYFIKTKKYKPCHWAEHLIKILIEALVRFISEEDLQ